MWPFDRGWPLNGGPLNRGSTVLFFSSCRDFRYLTTWLSAVGPTVGIRLPLEFAISQDKQQ